MRAPCDKVLVWFPVIKCRYWDWSDYCILSSLLVTEHLVICLLSSFLDRILEMAVKCHDRFCMHCMPFIELSCLRVYQSIPKYTKAKRICPIWKQWKQYLKALLNILSIEYSQRVSTVNREFLCPSSKMSSATKAKIILEIAWHFLTKLYYSKKNCQVFSFLKTLPNCCSLRAYSHLSHACELWRAKQCGMKVSGEEVPQYFHFCFAWANWNTTGRKVGKARKLPICYVW